MVISKFICIPLLIIVPLIILYFESREKDFTIPPSDEVVEKKVEAWKLTRPSLKALDQKASEDGIKPEQAKPKKLVAKDAIKGIDLSISPGLDYLQEFKAKRLKNLAKQLDPDLYPEFVYLANERILDSAPDSSVDDLHIAGEYIRNNSRPLWNPEASSRVAMKVNLNVEEIHYEKAKVFSPKLESVIFYGSGGTVEATVVVSLVEKGNNSISLTGKVSTEPVAVKSIPETENMIVNAVQLAVTKAIKNNKLPILHTDKIHYTYYTRMTWLMLAESL